MKKYNLNLKVVFIDENIRYWNFENTVKKYFESKGYKVESNNPFNDKGIPDFKISNELETFYVEAKKHSDWLRGNQLRWMCEHPENRYVLVIEKPRKEVVAWVEKYRIYCLEKKMRVNHNE